MKCPRCSRLLVKTYDQIYCLTCGYELIDTKVANAALEHDRNRMKGTYLNYEGGTYTWKSRERLRKTSRD